MSITVEQFVERLTASGLMTAQEIGSFRKQLPARPKDVQQFAQALVQHGKLTKYQAQAVYQGKTKGLVFGKYTVLDKIGEGGMGVVLKAQHRRMKRIVAIKLLPATAMRTPHLVERFYREAEAAARLNHANIVQAYDAGEHDGVHYLVMEYIDGKDLAAIVNEKGPLPVLQAVESMVQVARGLEYAHAQGIVHRDIKPNNLLVDKQGVVKILDMGLARIAAVVDNEDGDRLTTTGQVIGTCDFMAPEQVFDSHHVDARADIYSLGCTLYWLLVGRTPYDGETLMQVPVAHRESPVPSLGESRADVPPSLDAICRKMMAKELDQRQQSMGEVIADLERSVGKRLGAAQSLGEHSSSSADVLGEALSFLQNTPRPSPSPTPRAGTKTPPAYEKTTAYQPTPRPQPAAALPRRPAAIHKRKLLAGTVAGAVLILACLTLFIVGKMGHRPNQPEASKDERASTEQTLTPPSPEPETVASPAVAPFDAAQAKAHQAAWAKHLGVRIELTNTIGMKLVLIPPGEFEMGSTPGEITQAIAEIRRLQGSQSEIDFVASEGPLHRVRITKPFRLAAHEVTVGQFRRFVDATGYKTDAETSGKGGLLKLADGKWEQRPEINWRNPGFAQDADCPVTQMSGNDAVAFCMWLSRKERAKYRLPTEAEWEYACRAGSITRWCSGNDEAGLDAYAWHIGNSGLRTHPIGAKRPNAWGLYDMHGNAKEWCADWYGAQYYAASAADDPVGPESSNKRVMRGGLWSRTPDAARSACRAGHNSSTSSGCGSGFRVVRNP